jgi:hypothetical protein
MAMVMARTLVVVPRRPRKAAKIRVQRRLAAALRRYLSELTAPPDRGAPARRFAAGILSLSTVLGGASVINSHRSG